MTGKHFDNTFYHFVVTALKRNQNIDITYFPVKASFDTSILKNEFDVILLWSAGDSGNPDELLGIEKLNDDKLKELIDLQKKFSDHISSRTLDNKQDRNFFPK